MFILFNPASYLLPTLHGLEVEPKNTDKYKLQHTYMTAVQHDYQHGLQTFLSTLVDRVPYLMK